MGRDFLLLSTLILLLSGFVSSAPSANSPAKIINGFISNHGSSLMKWIWSLKTTSSKTTIATRSMVKFEDGYSVETVFDGSKLGIEPYSVEVLPNGELLVLDSENSNIYKISSSLSLYSRPRLVTGSPEGYAGHVDGRLRDARLNHPKGLAVDDRGNIYVADTVNNAIRKISEGGVTTIAGGKTARNGGHVDGPSEDAKFSNDFDVVYLGSSCSLLVIDRGNKAIREIQLHFDDCAYQYESGFPLGMAVLVAAGFFGYMLALLQRRVGSIVSSQNVSVLDQETSGGRHKRWPLRPLGSALIRSRFFCLSSAAEIATTPTTEAFPLKHVTRSNFERTLNDLRTHVKAADFVAIDLEMTGVTSAPWRDSLEFDRYDVRYLKVKDSAEKFAVVQFGVCPFRWDSHTHSFVSHPHNFFIFPRQEFLCQTTSIDFLAKYQFDFNTCIHEGISYLSRRQEDDAIKMLYDEEGLVEADDFKLVRLAHVLFAERMKNKLNEWRSDLLHCRNASSESPGSSTQSTETVFYHMRPALSLKGFTSHQLRVIRLVLGKHFRDLVYIHANDKSSQDFVVYTDSQSDKANLLKEAKDERKGVAERKIQSAIGFRQVIDLLSSEKKLIVGHNSILDIAHVYSKFVGPLPSTAEEFVASIRDHFPYIVDTKILVNVNPMLHQRMKKSSTSLSSAFSSLCPQVELPSRGSDSFLQQRVKIDVQVDNVRCSKWNAGGKHEAGYDAFMTGCIFAQACSHLGFDFNHPSVNIAQDEKLEKYINRLYLSWARGDIIDLRASHSNAENWRVSKFKYEKIVLIWNFPRKLKAREIKECICKAFGSTSVTSVYHLDDTAVFVLFKNSELVSEFLKIKEQLESDDGPVTVIHPLSKILEGGKTGAADYEAYKEICSSHISKVLFSDQAETVGVKSRTRPDPKGEASPETERREKTDKASDLIDAFLANRVKVEAAGIN